MERYSKKWIVVVCFLLLLRVAWGWMSLVSSQTSGILMMIEIGAFIAFMSINFVHFRREHIYEWARIFRYLLRYCSLYILLGALLQIATLKMVGGERDFPLVSMIYLSVFPYLILLILNSFVLFFLLRLKKK